MISPLVVIPARFDSSRLPGKLIRRLGPRTLIEWTWRAACGAGFPVVVATDSVEIEREVQGFGGRTIRTGPCQNGTERCAEAIDGLADPPALVLNWQGDSPLAPAVVTRQILEAIEPQLAPVATAIRRVCLADGLDPGQSCAVVAPDCRALYFSRAALPPAGPWWCHLGLYAYTASALGRYGREAGALEQAESLEQLRWLELGIPVRCVEFAGGPVPEVNLPADVQTVAKLLGVGP